MATTPNISTFELPQLTDLIERSFEQGLKDMDWELRNSPFVLEESMPMSTWAYKRYAERLNLNRYAGQRDEGDQAIQARVQYGYEKDLAVNNFALELGVTKMMRIAGKGDQIQDVIDQLVTCVPNRMELDLAHRFTFYSATSYVNADGKTVSITVGDGLALGSASHTLTGSATTYSNIITSNPVFAESALETAEKSFVENTYNNLGEKMTVKPDTILTTDDPDTCNAVRKLMNATADVTTSNSGTFNVYKNKYKHVYSSRIATTATGATDSSKDKYWALIASQASDFHLAILENPYLLTPKKGNNGEDISTETWTYVAWGTRGITIVTPKWIRLSNGSGS